MFMNKLDAEINSISVDYKSVSLLNTQCFMTTIVETDDNPYGKFKYYTNHEETYMWNNKLHQVKTSGHYHKIKSIVYDNGVNSCEKSEVSRIPLTNFIDEDRVVNTHDVVIVNTTADYSYNPDLKSTHFMIGIDLSKGISPIFHDYKDMIDIKVKAIYGTDIEHIEQTLIPQEDLIPYEKQNTPIGYRVVPDSNGFIIKFYNLEYNPEYSAYNYDFIFNHKRDIHFEISFSVQANSLYSQDTECIYTYTIDPTTVEDEYDKLYIQINELSEDDKNNNPYNEVVFLNDNLKVTIAHFTGSDEKDNYDIVLGYIYTDYYYTSRAHTNNFEVLSNLIHEDAI